MKNPFTVLIRPLLTEKSMAGTTKEEPQYEFRVQMDSNKIEIKRAVEAAFNVKVKRVNTIRVKGKMKRVRIQRGKRPDWKKAVVTLERGQSIELF